MTAVAALDLAADFPGPEGRGVHVGVRRTGADRAHQVVEPPGADSLSGDGDHLVSRNRPGHGVGPGTATLRRGRNRRSAGRLAQPDHDAAGRVPLAEVDVGLTHVARQTLEAQLVMNCFRTIVDHGPKTPAGLGRYGATLRVGASAVNLVVTGEPCGRSEERRVGKEC